MEMAPFLASQFTTEFQGEWVVAATQTFTNLPILLFYAGQA
jgi:hypothetical protein